MRGSLGLGGPLMLAPVRDRSEWVWESRWRQLYFVVASVAVVAALVGLLIGGRVVLGLVVFAAAAALGGLFLAGRRRYR